jgi:hypothetical protein
MGVFRTDLKCFYRVMAAAVTAFTIFAISSHPVLAAEYDLNSRTYLYLYERDQVVGDTLQYAPLYEYLSLDVWEVGNPDLSIHFYGWGRLDLGEETRGSGTNGSLSSAYLQYLHPKGNSQVKLGRFFLTEGTTAEVVDGLFVKGVTKSGFGAALYGGGPVENSITSSGGGDSLFGGRVFYVFPGVTEIGLGYFLADGDYQGENREEVGGDLWLRFAKSLDLTGKAVYNVITEDIASHRLALRLVPVRTIDLQLGTEGYKYKDLFQGTLNPAFLPPSINPDDEVQNLFADLDWQASKILIVQAGIKSISHLEADPGDALRGEAGFRFNLKGAIDLVGLSAAVQTADQKRDEYQEFRGWLMGSVNRWKFSLDGLTWFYEETAGGEDTTVQVVGSAGYQISPAFALSGDLRYTQSPQFKEDVALLLRADLKFGSSGRGE